MTASGEDVRALSVTPTRVFALGPGGGNEGPVLIGGEGLTERERFAIASSLGAECTFVLAPTEPGCAVRLRFYVPTGEMEMCVHGTIAATTVLVAEGMLTGSCAAIQTALGAVCVSWAPERDRLAVSVDQFAPTFGEALWADGAVATDMRAALGIPQSALDPHAGPLQTVSASRSKLMVPLRDWRALDALAPDWAHLWSICDELGTTGVYAFTTHPRNRHADVDARQFPRRAGFVEDPATGTAAAALAAYLAANADQRAPTMTETGAWHSFVIEQGHVMGRPSVLRAEAYRDDKTGDVRATRVVGSAQIERPRIVLAPPRAP